MILTAMLSKTWQDVESAYAETPIEIYTEDRNRNQAAFVLAFYKSLEPRLNNLHAMYDARCLSDQSYRPNFIIWTGVDEPIVIFMGDVKFAPGSLTEIMRGISNLSEYASRSMTEVLSSHDSTEIMKVSPNVEYGYFVVSDLSYASISQRIASQILSPDDLARFHFAYASINRIGNFSYQNPLPTGVDA